MKNIIALVFLLNIIPVYSLDKEEYLGTVIEKVYSPSTLRLSHTPHIVNGKTTVGLVQTGHSEKFTILVEIHWFGENQVKTYDIKSFAYASLKVGDKVVLWSNGWFDNFKRKYTGEKK